MLRLTTKEVKNRVKAVLSQTNSVAKIKVIGEYESSHSPIPMSCSVHGQFKKLISDIRLDRPTLICPSCSRDAISATKIAARKKEYLKELKRLYGGTIKLVGPYIDIKTKAWHLCTVCGHKSNVVPHSKINGHGCAVCARVKAQEKRGIPVTVKGASYRVEGYEGRALVYLTNALNVKPENILAFSTGKVPSISYTHENKSSGKGVYTHYYHPDFYVKETNTLYEVKSTMTLGLFVPEVYRRNRSKAKGCVAQGYKHVLILVLRDGQSIALDKWYKKSRKSLILHLHECYLVQILQ